MEAKPTREGSASIKVWCLPEERQGIAAGAAAGGLSLSAYLPRVGTGYEIRSVIDQQWIIELAKINADQGRLGGLLKLWLANDEKLAASHNPEQLQRIIHRVLERIQDTQAALQEVVNAMVDRSTDEQLDAALAALAQQSLVSVEEQTPGQGAAPSPTLQVLEQLRRPRDKTVCEACPNSVWFASPLEVKCYCRVMFLISWSTKEPNQITLCDGVFLGQD
ncbi:MAG: hypothetical protein ABI612_18820 [Betaproteobacteria bacterium]